MKINHPVTDHEITLLPGTILITKTDLKGRITFVNDAFVEVCGYPKEELIGNEHHIVRHPDMPPAVFEDLWNSLNAGRPWVGILKNRSKSGDYFWVEANINPIYKQGSIKGYMSVYSAANQEKIKIANQLYGQIRNTKKQLRTKSWLSKIDFIGRLSIGAKIGLLGMMMVLPSLILIKLLVAEKNVNIQYAEQEIRGLEYIIPLKQLLVEIIQHRSAVDVVLHKLNDKTAKNIGDIKIALANDINSVDTMDAVHGEAFKTLEKWQAIKHDWSELGDNALKMAAEDSYSQHNRLIEKVTELIADVSDKSNLTLDPEPDTYYLMTIVTVLVPELYDYLNDFRNSNIYNAQNGGQLSEKAKIQIAIFDQRIRSRSVKIIHNLGVIYEVKETLKSVLEEKENDFSMKALGLLQLVKREILGANTITVSADQVAGQGADALMAVDDLNQTTIALLKAGLNDRKARLETAKFNALTIVSFAILMVSLIGYLNVTNIVRTLKQILQTFSKIGEGEFDNVIDLNKHDELGDLLRGLHGMQSSLNVNISEARDQAIKSTRVQRALDNANSCVMLADNNFRVIYMNQAIQALFMDAEADIRQQLPDFDASKILGANIDLFYENPTQQRGFLIDLRENYQSELKIGSRYFNISVNPVMDAEGHRIGTVIEWLDRTLEVKIEQEIADIVTAVKAGELSNRIDLNDKCGFFEKLSIGINEFSSIIDNVFKDIGNTMQGLSDGDLTKTITSNYEGDYLDCKNSINQSLEKLADIVKQIKDSSGVIRNSAQEISAGNNSLSERVEQQATNLQHTASSMAELTKTVKTNSDNAQQANHLAEDARKVAENGGGIVKSAISAMQEINESSNRIAEIIGVIDDIAFQTNLLALNASVEAARAGEQGRGFSVVATEVRNLAQRSALAAKQSKELIQNSQQKVRAGSEFVNETGDALIEIVNRVKKVSNIVAEIAAASVQQTNGINQVTQAISQIDEITQQNAALAEQTSATSLSMSSISSGMVDLLEFFKIGDLDRNAHSNDV